MVISFLSKLLKAIQNIYQPTIKLINMSTQPSICIPRAFSNITEERVRRAIDSFGAGKISKIDLVERVNHTGEKYKRVFIHFEYWYETPHARRAKEDILAGKEIKIMYDNPWFWKASMNKCQTKAPVAPKLSIDEQVKNAILNIEASLALVAELSVDHRPYSERRLDPKYVQQDVEQGFNRRVRKDDCRPYRERRLDPKYLNEDVEQGFKLRGPRSSKPTLKAKVIKKLDWANAESDSEGDEEEPAPEIPKRKPVPRYHEEKKQSAAPVYVQRPKQIRRPAPFYFPPHVVPHYLTPVPDEVIAPAVEEVEEVPEEVVVVVNKSDDNYRPHYSEILESPPPLIYGDLPFPKRKARVIMA